MLKIIGRYLDKTWRRFRPYLLPEFKRAYKKLMLSAKPVPEGKLVVFDFHSNRIDGPQGRRFFNLFTFFTRAGYFPVFVDHYAFLANPRNNFKAECFKQPFSVIDSPATVSHRQETVIVISDLPVRAGGNDRVSETHSNRGTHRFCVSLAVDEQLGPNEFPWPFPMFPGLYRINQDSILSDLRRQERPWGFFFGGQSASHKYDKNWVKGVYGKVTRSAYLAIARETLAAGPGLKEPENNRELDTLLSSPVQGGVLVYNEKCKIPLEQWLPVMARSRFFFACPGVRYPMSHNTVEALAVGSVPIIEYPEDFYPALQDGINCLTFTGEAGLKAAIERAASLNEAEWQGLSSNAIEFYEHHLSPVAAVNRLLESQANGANTIKLVPFLKRGGGHI
jgi:hypothetical protein